MTRQEFDFNTPEIIMHPSHGESFRYITVDKKTKEIIVGYKNRHGHNSYGTIGKSFQEVYDSLNPFLQEKGLSIIKK